MNSGIVDKSCDGNKCSKDKKMENLHTRDK